MVTDPGVRTVKVQADSLRDDHAAVVQTALGEAITIRRTGGDFVLDLASFANKTVVLALVSTYAVGKPTTAAIQAFEVTPVDEFSLAGDEIVPIGTVDVPAATVPDRVSALEPPSTESVPRLEAKASRGAEPAAPEGSPGDELPSLGPFRRRVRVRRKV